ncbi:hypothetical protein LJB96_00240 [Methanobrevibacter sp. OttesenSCG-928-K11]|nr:hypothetical protein [Methanobrevibacter sp. OttesenSCG-928-K11]MDL2270901.1 hypothetical protein [Methanobrevibacter sp. OttesenSCG-928-I08]
MNDEELMKKCNACDFYLDENLLMNCRDIVGSLEDYKDELELSNEDTETYLQMVENLKPTDVSKVLQIAMNIVSNPNIKDSELQVNASRLIRAIQMD